MKAFDFGFRPDGNYYWNLGIALDRIRVRQVIEFGFILGDKTSLGPRQFYPEKVRLNRFYPPVYDDTRVSECGITWVKVPARDSFPAHQFLTLSTPANLSGLNSLVRIRTKCSTRSSSPGEIKLIGEAVVFLTGSGFNDRNNSLGGVWVDALVGLGPNSGVIVRPGGLKQGKLARAIFYDEKQGLLCSSTDVFEKEGAS